MERKEYSAGAVKLSFWFIEFRKVVKLLNEGESPNRLRLLPMNANLFYSSTIFEPIRFIIPLQAASRHWTKVSYPFSYAATLQHKNSLS